MRATYVGGVTLALALVGCNSDGDGRDESDERAAYEQIYGTVIEEGLEILRDICAGDEESDEIFVFMATESDDERTLAALRAICPEFVDETLDG
jgi:hypothetical protein